MIKRIILLLIALFISLTICGSATAANSTEIISISTNGSISNGYSSEAAVSADGRYITFSSYADNLVAGDNNSCSDIFVHDRVLNTTKRISISNSGEESNGDSYGPSISSDGRYVAYTSYATNLVASDNNGYSDVFVYDCLMNITQRVSISNNGNEGNGDSYDPSISADGSYIAFSSSASNLVTDDTNGCNDVFVYNKISNTIKRISVSNTGEEGNGDSSEPSISANGNFIAFTSYADNLVNNDINGCSDVFVYNQTFNTIKRISISSKGAEGYGSSYGSSISADGNSIAFVSYADNLVTGDNNDRSDVFVYDLNSGTTERISVLNSGEEIQDYSYSPSISGDGRYVAFIVGKLRVSVALSNTNLDNYYPYGIVVIRDRTLKTTEEVSISNLYEIANSNCESPSISADGSCIAFSSYADNLVPVDNNCYHIFVRDTNNHLQLLSGSLNLNIVKSGDIITIKAYSGDVTNITALIFNNKLNLIKQPDNTWILNYTIPQVQDGTYSVLLTATDAEGNTKNLSLDFTVDNTPPTSLGTITPNLVRSGNAIIINVSSDSDTKSIVASIAGSKNLSMYKEEDGIWRLYYTIPSLSSGNYTAILTATDNVGNQGIAVLNFTVDNTPPTINATISPDSFQLINNCLPLDNTTITIKASSDLDTKNITVNNRYNMIQQQDGTWIFTCSFQDLFDQIHSGQYSISLSATDSLGNLGVKKLNLELININPTINVSASPYAVKPGDYVLISVSSSLEPKEIWGYFVGYSDYDQGWVSYKEEIPNLTKQEDGIWTTSYKVPNITNGLCNILLTLYYGNGITPYGFTAGIVQNVYAKFRVDSTPPRISPFTDPSIIKSGDILKIRVYSYISRLEYWTWGDDTASVNANLFNKTLNMTKMWFDGYESLWEVDYTVPNLPDGNYTIFFTATDEVGNPSNASTNFTVDNTPPVMTATITPNKVKSIDFQGDRLLTISANSSPDTKEVYARILGSWTPLTYENGKWTLTFSVAPLMDVGNYKISLQAIDYAGNIETTSVYFTVYNNLINQPGDSGQNNGTTSGESGQGGSGSGSSSGSSGSGASSGSNNGGSSESGSSSSGSSSGDSSGGSGSGGSSGGSGGSGGGSGDGGSDGPSYPDYLPYLLLAIGIIMVIVALMLILGIFGFLLDLLLYMILDILFADVPEILGITFEFLDTITGITSISGFSLNSIAMAMSFITADIFGIVASIFLVFLAYFVSIGVLGGLFGLFIALIGFWLMITTFIGFINSWKQNKL